MMGDTTRAVLIMSLVGLLIGYVLSATVLFQKEGEIESMRIELSRLESLNTNLIARKQDLDGLSVELQEQLRLQEEARKREEERIAAQVAKDQREAELERQRALEEQRQEALAQAELERKAAEQERQRQLELAAAPRKRRVTRAS